MMRWLILLHQKCKLQQKTYHWREVLQQSLVLLRGAALAARAKVLLYAASPINNPHPSDTEKFSDMVNFDGKHLIAQEYDETKWARAAAAALDVMELPGNQADGKRYDLYHLGRRYFWFCWISCDD